MLTRRLEERTVDASASGSVRLGAELPDAGQVIRWQAFATVDRVGTEPGTGRVEAQGRVRVWAVYTARGSESSDPLGAVFGGHLEGEPRWMAWIDAPASSVPTVWDVRVQVRDVEGRFRADGRTADVDVVLSVTFSGAERQTTSLVTHAWATPPDRLEVVSAPLRLQVLLDAERSRFSVSESRALDLPAGAGTRFRVLDVRATPSITQVEAKPGAVVVRGEIGYELLYAVQRSSRTGAAAGDETPIADAGLLASEPEQPPATESSPAPSGRHWEAALASWSSAEPFVVTVPLANSGPAASGRAFATVSDVVVRAAPAEGIVHVTAEVDLAVHVYGARTLPVVTDLRPSEPTEVEQRRVSLGLESYLGEGRRTFSAQATVELPAGGAAVDRVLWCGARVESVSWRPEGSRLQVSLTLSPWMYYLPYRPDARTGGLVFMAWPSAMAVEQAVAMGELKPQAQATVGVVNLLAEADLINRQTVEFTVSGMVVAEARLGGEQEVVAEAVVAAPQEQPPPFFYLVVTQPGDTLWKLARRYRTSEQAIAQANPSLANLAATAPLGPGQRLFILR